MVGVGGSRSERIGVGVLVVSVHPPAGGRRTARTVAAEHTIAIGCAEHWKNGTAYFVSEVRINPQDVRPRPLRNAIRAGIAGFQEWVGRGQPLIVGSRCEIEACAANLMGIRPIFVQIIKSGRHHRVAVTVGILIHPLCYLPQMVAGLQHNFG